MRAATIALWSALVLVALLGLLGISRALFSIGGIDWSFGISVLIIWWMTICIAAAGTVIARGRMRAAMVVTIVSAAAVISVVCIDMNGPEWLVWGLWYLAAGLVHVGLLVTADLRMRGARIVRWVALGGLGLMFAGMFSGAMELFNVIIIIEEDIVQRVVMAAAIVSAAGTLAMFLLAGIEARQKPDADSLPPAVALAAACPRCNAPNTFPAGQSECQSCGLRVTLEIEEPRCPCGYLLYKLDSPHCPECGRLVRHEPSKGKTTINA